MNRRTFLQTATVGATSLAGSSWAGAMTAENEKKTSWPIGCFNRAWSKWSYDDALEGIAAAGYQLTGFIYYTGKDPVMELEPIARHVTGFCAKDCPAPKGEVMSQFGTGKVDFRGVFAKLKSAGFNGPIMVEGIQVGATTAETTAHARANQEFLEKVVDAI